MQAIFENAYTWFIFNEEKKLNFNGLYLKVGASFALVDPPPLSEQDQAFISETGKPSFIYLTNKHHTRGSADHRKRWGAKLFIHKKDAPLMEIPVDGTFGDGETLSGELQVLRIPDAKTPGECAFWWKRNKTLVVGDAVIGKPAGGLSMLPDEKFKNPMLARQGLSVLREFDFDRLLVGDGTSLLGNAKKIFENFIAASN
ncbi:MAG: hypothetical protein U1F57_03550 [bacterium]